MADEQIDWYAEDAATFGDRVAAAREAAGMSQAQLARRLGVKKSTIIGWEQDLSEPRANRLSMMSGLLNVSIMWLMTGEGNDLGNPDADSLPPGLQELLRELRVLRSEIRSSSERAAKIEKRLVRMVEDVTND